MFIFIIVVKKVINIIKCIRLKIDLGNEVLHKELSIALESLSRKYIFCHYTRYHLMFKFRLISAQLELDVQLSKCRAELEIILMRKRLQCRIKCH